MVFVYVLVKGSVASVSALVEEVWPLYLSKCRRCGPCPCLCEVGGVELSVCFDVEGVASILVLVLVQEVWLLCML